MLKKWLVVNKHHDISRTKYGIREMLDIAPDTYCQSVRTGQDIKYRELDLDYVEGWHT